MIPERPWRRTFRGVGGEWVPAIRDGLSAPGVCRDFSSTATVAGTGIRVSSDTPGAAKRQELQRYCVLGSGPDQLVGWGSRRTVSPPRSRARPAAADSTYVHPSGVKSFARYVTSATATRKIDESLSARGDAHRMEALSLRRRFHPPRNRPPGSVQPPGTEPPRPPPPPWRGPPLISGGFSHCGSSAGPCRHPCRHRLVHSGLSTAGCPHPGFRSTFAAGCSTPPVLPAAMDRWNIAH